MCLCADLFVSAPKCSKTSVQLRKENKRTSVVFGYEYDLKHQDSVLTNRLIKKAIKLLTFLLIANWFTVGILRLMKNLIIHLARHRIYFLYVSDLDALYDFEGFYLMNEARLEAFWWAVNWRLQWRGEEPNIQRICQVQNFLGVHFKPHFVWCKRHYTVSMSTSYG